MSLSQNQLVRAFTRTRHMAHTQQQLYKMTKVKDHIRNRHQKAKKNYEKIHNKSQSKQLSVTKSETMIKQISEHMMTLDELSHKYEVDFRKGLSDEQARIRLQQYGQNKMIGTEEQSCFLLFISQMADPFSLFMWLMIVLSLVAFGLSEPKDTNPLFLAIIIFITIITGAIISYQFVKDSQQMIKTFNQILPTFANVRRNEVVQIIKSEQIVPGDILIIAPGQKISADIRLIQSHHLFFSKAIFSGQNDQILASVDCTNKTNPIQSKNIIFSGYISERGNGIGIVIGTGKNSLISHLSNYIECGQTKVTNIEKQISRYVKIMTIFAVTVGVVVLIVGGLIGYDWLIAAMIAIGVTLASAPTVLNLVIVIMFTISVKKLAKHQIICKNLNVIQSLGSTSCLVVDKTGTITQSIMQVSNFAFNNQRYSAKDILQNKQLQDTTFQDINKCAILSSVAQFNSSPPPLQISKISSRTDITQMQKIELQQQYRENWKKKCKKLQIKDMPTIGDSTESALIKFFQNIQDIKQTRQKYPPQHQSGKDFFFAFDVLKKYSYCIVQQQQNNVLYIKGYPDVIWNLCTQIQVDGQIRRINSHDKEQYNEAIELFGNRGQRNIALAKKVLQKKSNPSLKSLKIIQSMKAIEDQKNLGQLIYLGVVSLSDPIKQGIQQTISRVKAAGIKIVMVTGDHSTTAVSVARETKIIQQPHTVQQIMIKQDISLEQALLHSEALVISGDDLYKLQIEDESLAVSQKDRNLQKLLAKRQVIFCKTNPSQKLFILQTLQKMGHIICAIGDGVNDSPVVKFADAGISMGTGADATKQAAGIIFVDNDINHIIMGIQEGRKIFDNLKKSICYVMTSQMSEWLPFVVLLAFRIPIPVFTLLIDGTADFVPAISFAFQDGQLGLMTRKPRNQDDHLVSYKLLAQCSGWMGFSSFLCSLTCYYICMSDFGFQPNQLWGKNNIPILLPQANDAYNPTSPFYGNSRLADYKFCQQFDQNKIGIDWINSLHPTTDLRMAALTCQQINGIPVYKQNIAFKQCSVQQISIITKKPVCYTTQAAKYGQTAYMYANVMNQVFNLFICKTRRESVFTQKFDNYIIYMGFTFQLMLALALNQTIFMVNLIGTRDTIYMHYGLAAIPFGIVQLILDQIRKFLIRNLPPSSPADPERGKQSIPNWFERYVLW